MLRAFFFALGMFLCLVGGELFFVDRVVTTLREEPQTSGRRWAMSRGRAGRQKIINPPEWAPWLLTSAGAVIVLYSVALPKGAGAKS